MSNLKEIDAVILCGGLGKRLRPIVSDRPKSMAEINGRPFLDILLDYLSGSGIRRFILAVGYMADSIKRQYRSGIKDSEIVFSQEHEQLGTAGAVKNAEPLIKSLNFLVINGDTFCKFDLEGFLDFHLNKNALVSIALVNNSRAKEAGSVLMNESGEIIEFTEKKEDADNRRFTNAGIYLFNSQVLKLIPENRNFSLESDLFPSLKGCYGYITNSSLIDIGTLEGYEKGKQILCD